MLKKLFVQKQMDNNKIWTKWADHVASSLIKECYITIGDKTEQIFPDKSNGKEMTIKNIEKNQKQTSKKKN